MAFSSKIVNFSSRFHARNYEIDAAALERCTNVSVPSLNTNNLQNVRFVQNDSRNLDEEGEVCDDIEIIDNVIYASF